MSACITAEAGGLRAVALRPEWLVLPLSAAAWLLLLWPASEGIALCLDPALSGLSGGVARLQAAWRGGALLRSLLGWAAMTVAMMLPLATAMLRHVAQRSFAARRWRAAGAFIAGYLAPWALLGLAVVPLAVAAPPRHWLPAAAFLLAAGWQLTAWKAAAFRRCHRTRPLAPRSWRADRDCLRFGALHALACAANCWPAMLACALTPQGVLPMACAQAVMIAERRTRLPRAAHSAIALAACAVLTQ